MRFSLHACLCAINEANLDPFSRPRADHDAFVTAEQHRIRFGGPGRVAEGGRPETIIIIVEAQTQADEAAWSSIKFEKQAYLRGFSNQPVAEIVQCGEPPPSVKT